MKNYPKGTFGYDLAFLSQLDRLVVLKSDDEKAQIIVSPGYQGKVFTSTLNGCEGQSMAWLNYTALESAEKNIHVNNYGGENRFWLGPEGGQYSLFFAKGKEQIYDNWFTPSAIDTEPWQVKMVNLNSVTLCQQAEITNAQGSQLKIALERTVELMNNDTLKQTLGVDTSGTEAIAYQTYNTITNLNDFAWDKESGTVCAWMLDMYPVSDGAETLIPYRMGDENQLGRVATSDYFGEIPAERLVDNNQGMLRLKTDGKYRSKVGVNALRTTKMAANYSPERNLLTIITFEVDRESTYLNQEWRLDRDPTKGDALNLYNDGPLEDGSIMGPFLELESCSPAAFLAPQESMTHNHNVFHLSGSKESLSRIAQSLFGTAL